jgi:2-C-methyl-D-erythritol 4-phosphate cytidylyltransferase
VVALPRDDRRFARLAVTRHPRLQAVTGGNERSDSVRLALASLPAGESDWVLVHDAARPCVSRDEIDALLAGVADDIVGGVLALPVADTLKESDEHGRVRGTATRTAPWRALTPADVSRRVLRTALMEPVRPVACRRTSRRPWRASHRHGWCAAAAEPEGNRAGTC